MLQSKYLVFLFSILLGSGLKAQNGVVTGNMESIFQYLNKDSVIGANQPAEKGLLNSYINVFYTNSNFKAGMRLESYLPRIQGYPDRFDGTGLGYRYVGYKNDFIDITLGNFYEQFGSGLIFRAYEDRALGFDNAMDGMRVILKPYKGVTLKGVYGKQRFRFLNGSIEKGAGLVRGFDAEFHINELVKALSKSKYDITLGSSFVSKYQKDDNVDFILPENVGSYGGRIKVRHTKLFFDAEYVHKDNDPSADNSYTYQTGHAALWNLGYTTKGFGIIFSGKSVSNMSFRSDRLKDGTDLFVNFLPAMNKTHTYNLVATLYPYATQPLGEIAFQGEMLYTVKRGTKLGGKYGLPININYSTAYLPVLHASGLNDSLRRPYEARVFDLSDSLLWQDFNINIVKKFNKNLSVTAAYFWIKLNNDVVKITNTANSKGVINAHIGVLEGNYKINSKHSLRGEFQMLFTEKDNGDWMTFVMEYSVSPHWFFGVMDQFNFGNSNRKNAINDGSIISLFSSKDGVSKADFHYPIGTFGYIKDATRVMLSYGRQRAGLFCVGGICRVVPASNGLTLTLTHSF